MEQSLSFARLKTVFPAVLPVQMIISVGDEDDVSVGDVFLDDCGAGSHEDASRLDHIVWIAQDQLRFHGLDHVFVGGLRVGKDGIVVELHVGVHDVRDGEDAVQVVLLIRDAEGLDVPLLHEVPRVAQAHLGVDAGLQTEVDVLHLGADAGAEPGRGHFPVVQDVLGFSVHVAAAAGLKGVLRVRLFLVPAVRDRGTDGICVGIFMAKDVHFISAKMS